MPSPQLTPFRKITALRSVLFICVPFSNSRHCCICMSLLQGTLRASALAGRILSRYVLLCPQRNGSGLLSRGHTDAAWRSDNLAGTHIYIAARQDFSGKPSCLNWAQSPAHCGHINITLGKKNSSRQVHSTNRGIRENYL